MNNDPEREHSRLSRIETLWSVVRQAHEADHGVASTAQRELIERYGGAIRRYLVGAMRNQDAADEVFQDFAFRFINGDFKAADPERGKFRSYVKTILFRMVAQHYRTKKTRKEQVLDVDLVEGVEPDESDRDSDLFLQSWRDEVLTKTWDAMESEESDGGPAYFTILRTRVEHPEANSNQLAELISTATGNEVTPGNARVKVHRARDKFANLLIETVAQSLSEVTRDAVESELIELGLIDYCRETLRESKRFD